MADGNGGSSSGSLCLQAFRLPAGMSQLLPQELRCLSRDAEVPVLLIPQPAAAAAAAATAVNAPCPDLAASSTSPLHCALPATDSSTMPDPLPAESVEPPVGCVEPHAPSLAHAAISQSMQVPSASHGADYDTASQAPLVPRPDSSAGPCCSSGALSACQGSPQPAVGLPALCAVSQQPPQPLCAGSGISLVAAVQPRMLCLSPVQLCCHAAQCMCTRVAQGEMPQAPPLQEVGDTRK
ncbi:hypothetical protein MMC29_003002 [Sticta canariensis]|nr:hypothetical protein [Sticta canariensis]